MNVKIIKAPRGIPPARATVDRGEDNGTVWVFQRIHIDSGNDRYVLGRLAMSREEARALAAELLRAAGEPERPVAPREATIAAEQASREVTS